MLHFFKNLYLSNRFFFLFGGIIVLFLIGFALPPIFPVALGVFALAIALVILDITLLFNKSIKIEGRRITPKLMSLSDENAIHIELHNLSNQAFQVTLVDELPARFQIRDFEKQLKLPVDEPQKITYQLRPIERGVYAFGKINVYLSTNWNLVERRIQVEQEEEVPVYPSIIQMKQIELQAFDRIAHHQGIKKLRRIGHSYEFDHIKNYVRGDDYRSLNWKASSRKGELMVNKYEDERSQQVYSIIDKSRNMRMPFNGLSLMDYAINSTLALSNVILRKHDRAGLLSFSDKMGTVLKADSRREQLNKILLALYKERERQVESNYELLYYATRKLVSGRSLLMLYTNFESMYALDRVLPILRKINKMHLLVVVFFENTEVKDFSQKEVKTLEDIYHQTIAQKFVTEKRSMVQKLQQYGIQAVLTRPEDLSIQTVNKYLELKSRGLI
ncbi:MAG: DUF58 domain-containing protein [Bacteroidota bacterium]